MYVNYCFDLSDKMAWDQKGIKFRTHHPIQAKMAFNLVLIGATRALNLISILSQTDIKPVLHWCRRALNASIGARRALNFVSICARRALNLVTWSPLEPEGHWTWCPLEPEGIKCIHWSHNGIKCLHWSQKGIKLDPIGARRALTLVVIGTRRALNLFPIGARRA